MEDGGIRSLDGPQLTSHTVPTDSEREGEGREGRVSIVFPLSLSVLPLLFSTDK